MVWNVMTMDLSQSRSRFVILSRGAETTPGFAFRDGQSACSRPFVDVRDVVARHLVWTQGAELETSKDPNGCVAQMRVAVGVLA